MQPFLVYSSIYLAMVQIHLLIEIIATPSASSGNLQLDSCFFLKGSRSSNAIPLIFLAQPFLTVNMKS